MDVTARIIECENGCRELSGGPRHTYIAKVVGEVAPDGKRRVLDIPGLVYCGAETKKECASLVTNHLLAFGFARVQIEHTTLAEHIAKRDAAAKAKAAAQ